MVLSSSVCFIFFVPLLPEMSKIQKNVCIHKYTVQMNTWKPAFPISQISTKPGLFLKIK